MHASKGEEGRLGQFGSDVGFDGNYNTGRIKNLVCVIN